MLSGEIYSLWFDPIWARIQDTELDASMLGITSRMRFLLSSKW